MALLKRYSTSRGPGQKVTAECIAQSYHPLVGTLRRSDRLQRGTSQYYRPPGYRRLYENIFQTAEQLVTSTPKRRGERHIWVMPKVIASAYSTHPGMECAMSQRLATGELLDTRSAGDMRVSEEIHDAKGL